MYGQYVPAASVPGLFTAVAILTQAREAMRVAQEVLTSIPSAPNPVPVPIPTPVSPIAVPSKSVESPKPAEEKKTIVAAASGQPAPVSVAAKPEIVAAPIAKVEEPAKPAVVSSAPPTTGSSVSQLSISSGSMAAPTSGVSRPLPTPARPSTPPRPSSGGSALEFVKDPKFLGGVGAVALLVLAGWFLLSFKNAARDIERLRELKQLLADVRSARTSGTTNFETLITRAKKITEEFTAAYKVSASNDYPAKQALFWAARDELPKLMSGDLTKESTSEKNLELRLKDASAMLGVK